MSAGRVMLKEASAGGIPERYVEDAPYFRLRPYLQEYTRSHLNSEVKPVRARQVPWWGTARENLRVL